MSEIYINVAWDRFGYVAKLTTSISTTPLAESSHTCGPREAVDQVAKKHFGDQAHTLKFQRKGFYTAAPKPMSKTETQVACPKCGQSGFIKLSAHRCTMKAKDVVIEVGEPQKTTMPALREAVGLPSKTPGKQEAKQITKLYQDAQNGMRRVVALGLYCHQVKENLPHGEFAKWIEANCNDVSYQSVRAYMLLASNVLEASGLQIASVLTICQGGKALLLPDKKVPADAKSVVSKICDMIDGKSQRQLMVEFREEEAEASATPSAGKRKFHPAKPKSAEEIVDAQTLAAVERVQAIIADLQQYVTTDDTGKLPDDVKRAALDASVEFSNHLRAALKGAK